MEKPKIRNLKIGSAGAININVPLITVGAGSPSVLLVCGMHGDEITGLLVVKKLLEEIELKRGTLAVIPSTNPLGQALGIRENPTDRKDLNRVYPGDKQGELGERIAYKIHKEAKNYDLVVDLHAFPTHTPIMGILIEGKDKKIRQQILEYLGILRPDVIWSIDTKKKLEEKTSGSLCESLVKKGKVALALEIPWHSWMTERQITKVVKSIKNLLNHLGVLDEKATSPERKREIPVVERVKITPNSAGVLEPKKKLLKRVKKDEVIATVTSIRTLKMESVRSPTDGILINISGPNLVNTGDVVAAIGKIIERL